MYKKKEILFFTRLFYPHIGGVEEHVMNLSSELIKKGYNVNVVTELYSKKLKHIENIKKINIYRIPVNISDKKKKFIIWKWLIKNRYLIKKASIVHCHDVAYWYFPFRLIFPSKPFYSTFHGYETHFPIKVKARLVRIFGHLLSSGTINIGGYVGKWYKNNPNYVMHGAVRNIRRVINSGTNMGMNVAILGRLEEDNSMEAILELLRKMQNNKISFSLTAIGKGIYERKLKNFGNVTGFVSDVRPYISRSIVIFASSYLSILECLIQKKVVFAVYDNPLKKDYLFMSPFSKYISIAGSSEELYEQVVSYMKNPEPFEKRAEAGYEFAKKQTWEKIADDYLRLWGLKKS